MNRTPRPLRYFTDGCAANWEWRPTGSTGLYCELERRWILAQWRVPQHQICKRLPCGKGPASHRRVDGIEDAQSMDIRNPAHGDRISETLNLALRIGERRPWRKARAVWIARAREGDPIAGHLLCQLPICRGPVPRRLV